MTSVVSDASPLIVLAKANLLHLLPELFSDVFVPRAVIDEITAGPGEPFAIGFLCRLPLNDKLPFAIYQRQIPRHWRHNTFPLAQSMQLTLGFS